MLTLRWGFVGGAARRGSGRGLPVLLLAIVALQACETLQWPIEGAMQAPFGVRGGGVFGDTHRGIDLAAKIGTPVRPVLSGRVQFAGTMRGYGNVVWIEHGKDALSVYGHLSEVTVKEGQKVTKSTMIGRTGQSGNATGPHLHFEFWRWGREVDPVKVLGIPPGK